MVAAVTVSKSDATLSPYRINIRISLIALAMLVAHLPLLLRLGQRMWNVEHYQFFPIVLGGAAFLCKLRWPEDFPGSSTDKARVRWFILVISMSTVALAILADSPWFAGVSGMVNLWTLIYLIGGRRLTDALLPAWIFLWLAVPLPLGIDTSLIQGMQQLATQWASGLLDLAGYRHIISGVVLELPGQSFEVEEACSGIHSLFAALSCTVFYSILLQRGLLRIACLMAATVFWVLVVNSARVALIVILSTGWSLPISDGVGHDLAGVVTFIICLLLIASTERLLLLFFPYPFKLREYLRPNPVGQQRRSKLRPWSRIMNAAKPRIKDGSNRELPLSPTGGEVASPSRSTPFGRVEFAATLLAFVGLAMGQFALGGVLGKQTVDIQQLGQVNEASLETLAAQIGSWDRVGFDSVVRQPDDINGEFSRIWRFQSGDRIVAISVDGPFIGWHDLGRCLVGQGWKIDKTHVGAFGSPEKPDYLELQIQKGLANHAAVIFAVFNGENIPAQPMENYAAFRTIRRLPQLASLLNRFTATGEDYAAPDSSTFQIQLFCESTQPMNEEELRELTDLFTSVVHQITQWPPKNNSGAK